MEKPDCYKCKYRRDLSGDCHSQCGVFGTGSLQMVAFAMYVNCDEKGVVGDPHGIKNGWFNWPLNFDPTWLEKCSYYEPKEETGTDSQAQGG